MPRKKWRMPNLVHAISRSHRNICKRMMSKYLVKNKSCLVIYIARTPSPPACMHANIYNYRCLYFAIYMRAWIKTFIHKYSLQSQQIKMEFSFPKQNFIIKKNSNVSSFNINTHINVDVCNMYWLGFRVSESLFI